MPLVHYDLGCAAVCVDIVIVITGTSVYGLSEVCVRLCGSVCYCAQREEDMFVCLHAYTVHTAGTCALCAFFLLLCVHVEADGSRFGWRCLGTRGSAETCLCAGSRGAGGCCRTQPA